MKIRTVLLMGAEESAEVAKRIANRIYGRQWRKRNPGATTERVRKWRQANGRNPEKRDPAYYRAYYYRTHERRRQLENERRLAKSEFRSEGSSLGPADAAISAGTVQEEGNREYRGVNGLCGTGPTLLGR